MPAGGRRRVASRLVVAAVAGLLLACSEPNDPEPALGSLLLTVSGLPDDTPADIIVTGPNAFSTRLTEGKTLTGLQPGAYLVTVARVSTSGATYDPLVGTLSLVVGAGSVSQAAAIYAIATGSIAVTVSGVPNDIGWKVHISGPGGFRDSVSANVTLGNLAPGIYTIATAELRRGPSIWASKPAEFLVTVRASLTPTPAAIGYSLITGSLSLHLNGLPGGVSGNVTLNGPEGFVASATASTLFEGLMHGRYDIVALPVNSGSGQFVAAQPRQSVSIVPGAVGLVNVNFLAGGESGLNLAVEAIQLQQVVQTYGGGIPSIAGRQALLRVFVRASLPNAVAPDVRVRLHEGQQLVSTMVIPAPSTSVPTVNDEGQLLSSWNAVIPAALMRPGLRLLVDVDPANTIAETVESDNVWPSSGAALELDVRTVPPLALTLVPVSQPATGLTGNITPANAPAYAEAALRMLPLSQLVVNVHPTYTTGAPALQPNDANTAWLQVLNEIRALWAAEGAVGHYYGVVKLPYSTGTIGLSFLPSFVAVGYDNLPNAAPTMVHELGHNFGRLHSPSCGAGGDGNYPYPEGTTGVYGYDAVSGALVGPSTPDIMGYCPQRWVSDYTFTGIFGFRSSSSNVFTQMASASAQPGLLVWGRISAAGIILEPAFEVSAPARLPKFGGPHSLDLLDEAGRTITTLSFHGDRAVDTSSDVETFAFVVPLQLLNGRTPTRLRLSSGGRRAELATSGSVADDSAPTAIRTSLSRIRVVWKDAPGRGVLVRDARTGQVLSFARGGRVDLRSDASVVDLTVSDGVRSTRRSVVIR